ncbi:MAG: chemotaxis protein CheW [Spirochaetaceae bacterium]
MIHSKYLLFSVSNEHYGIPIEKVKEIIRYEPISPVHDSLEYVKGVINLKGKIVPVFDLKLKFGMEAKEYTSTTVFIITDIIGTAGDFNVALVVDAVQEVSIINSDDVKEPPQMGLKIKTHFLKGIYRHKENMVMLLNIDEIIKEEAILKLTEDVYDKSSDS